MTGLEWNAKLPPPTLVPAWADARLHCSGVRWEGLSMNRPADEGNDYMDVFIF